jgi:hypothetical protein
MQVNEVEYTYQSTFYHQPPFSGQGDWAGGLEKEPTFTQNVCASDSASAAVSTSVILSNADRNAFS